MALSCTLAEQVAEPELEDIDAVLGNFDVLVTDRGIYAKGAKFPGRAKVIFPAGHLQFVSGSLLQQTIATAHNTGVRHRFGNFLSLR